MSDDTVPATYADLLEANGFAFVATTGPHQVPHVSPTWYLWYAANRHLLISLTTGRQKYRNMRRDPHVAACIPDPQNPYRHIKIRGTAEAIEPDVNHRLINALAKKYLDQDEYAPHMPGDVRVVVRIKPQRVRYFG